MNISELKTPIRIYWDLAPHEPGQDLDYLQIAEQIVGLKILSLDLTETASAVSHACLAILERLSLERIAVSLTLSLEAITPAVLSQLSRLRLKVLFASVTNSADLPAVQALRQSLPGAAGLQIGVSCAVTRGNCHDLPAILSFCVACGAPLVLPMQRLEMGGDCFQLGKAERQELAGRLREVGNLDKMRVTIHDPFLWRVFFPAVSFPNGSCQAANTMLHIAANGDVYPCPSLPVRLGSLATTPLSVIAVSPEKMNLRARLVSPPQGCLACAEVSNCLGGCRGRGYCVTDSWDEPDPGCGE